MKVLHVLETSVPELVGYTIRGRYIVEHQRRFGLDPLVATSPFFRGAVGHPIEVLDGIRYFRSNDILRPDKANGRLAAYWTRFQMLRRYRQFIADLIRREQPDVIHAHSSYTNGLAALYASRRTGIPFIYELRTLWGESAVVEDGLSPRSLKYHAVWRLELKVMRGAHRVIAISQGIRDAIVERGIAPEKIEIVPNGVDTGVFQPRPPDTILAQSLGLDGVFAVGFIGSLRRLEGLDLAIEAFDEVRRQKPGARLIIVGDGPERSRLEMLVRELGLKESVLFTGLVPHGDVPRYYSVMDVLVYPRIDARINHTVTPLKPLEAMAMGKPSLASDVSGLKELVEDQVTGLLFARGDVRDLADKLLRLATDPGLRERLGAEGLDYVRKEREWSVIVARCPDIYLRAGANTSR